MKRSLTIFKNLFDTDISKQMEFSDWDKFKDFLFSVSKMDGAKFDKNKGKNQKCTPLISPASYLGGSRKNDCVKAWSGWAALDIDDYIIKDTVQADMLSKFGEYSFVCYSTASSTLESPKFRIVLPLTCNVPNDKIRPFWHALNTAFDSLGDTQTKDLSRMYYAPAQYPNAYNFIFDNVGKEMDPFELIGQYPYAEKTNKSFLDALPESMRLAIIKEKQNRLTNTDISWNSYTNCPFWPRNLEKEYRTTSGSGWYGISYKIMSAIAANALNQNYPITAKEIAVLFRQFDNDTGGWYANRPVETEANRALSYIFKNSL